MNLRKKINNSMLELAQRDITLEETEAIVNAANKTLSPGGGVSGAIHRTAGQGLWEEAKSIGGCGTGEARITGGYGLQAKYVIHTVGPFYRGSERDLQNLKNSYYNSLVLALKNNIKSISFPSISTGIFGYPIEDASRIAFKTIINFLMDYQEIELIKMVLFSDSDYQIYKNSLKNILK